MENRFTDEMYVDSKGGLKKTEDTFKRLSIGEEFSRLVNGIDPFIEKANDIRALSKDIVVQGRDIKPYVDQDGIKLIVGDQPLHLTDWSLQQFSNRLGIPSQYAKKMAEAGKYDLFLDNFNSWLESSASGSDFLVRTYNDKFVRGVLTNAYKPVDADYLLPRIREGLKSTNLNFRVDKGYINPEMSNVRIISDRRMDIGGDPHHVGFLARSSDVGRSEIRVEFFVYRSKCANGMLFGKRGGILVSKRHTSKDALTEGYFEETLYAQLNRVDELVTMTSEALRDSSRKELKDEDVQRVIDRFKDYTSFSKPQAEILFNNVKQHVSAYDDNTTVWAVSNALTEMAQSYPATQAEKIEDFAGELLFSR